MSRSKTKEFGLKPTSKFVLPWSSGKVITLVSATIILFLLFSLLRSQYSNPPPLDISDLEDRGPMLGLDFKPRSCVIMPNGSCIPFDEHDGHEPITGKGLYVHEDGFHLDGQPFRIYSGSFHYFRTIPSLWGDRLLKMRAAGLNTVTTYIPWNLHEPVRGQYRFEGMWDLASFIKQVQNVGLHLIIRPGPYICAEWEFGGLPSWLLRDPRLIVRSSKHKPYLDAVEEYFSKLIPLLSSFSYKKRGPIIAYQIENEFGSYGRDPEYLQFLLDQYTKWNVDELLFTSDGPLQLPNGSIPHVFSTVNFKGSPDWALDMALEFQPKKPIMVTEYWAGWFVQWGLHNEDSFDSLEDFVAVVDYLLYQNVSINFYMFVGGSNFEFWNGANIDVPWDRTRHRAAKNKTLISISKKQKGLNLTTKKKLANVQNKTSYHYFTTQSYDYDAPISEAGDITPKFRAVRLLLEKHQQAPMDIPDIPRDSAKTSYPRIPIEESFSFTSLLDLVGTIDGNAKPVVKYDPVPMEFLDINNGGGQGYGWILYQQIIPIGNELVIDGVLADRAQVFLGGKEILVLNDNQQVYYRPKSYLMHINNRIENNTLEILVENCGRVNFRYLLNYQRKGLMGVISLDGTALHNWRHTPLEFNEYFRTALLHTQWTLYTSRPPKRSTPALYRGNLDISAPPQDTFLDMRRWTKGIVMINDFLLGRYWRIGPQQSLYVPAALLRQGRNVVTVFELHRPGKGFLFREAPVWAYQD